MKTKYIISITVIGLLISIIAFLMGMGTKFYWVNHGALGRVCRNWGIKMENNADVTHEYTLLSRCGFEQGNLN